MGLPVLAVLTYLLASTLGHALFLFLTAAVIAFLLNPLVRGLQRMRIPRGLAVAIVFVGFAAVVTVTLVAVTTVAVDQTRQAADRIDAYVTEENGRSGLTGSETDVDRLQAWLDDHGIHVEIRERANDWLDSLSAGEISSYTQDAISFARGAAISFVLLLFSLDPDRRDRDLHAARHAAARGRDRPSLSACGRAAADAADRARAHRLRAGAVAPVDDHRHERGRRHVDPRRDRPGAGRRELRPRSSACGRPRSR